MSTVLARPRRALGAAAVVFATLSAGNAAGDLLTAVPDPEIVTVRPGQSSMTKQGLAYFAGIGPATATNLGISMNLVVIPPGAAAQPHVNRGVDTAIYVLDGDVETRYGPGLDKAVVGRAGDLLFVPHEVPHQPVNLSADKPARIIIARNHPDAQRRIVPYHPAGLR